MLLKGDKALNLSNSFAFSANESYDGRAVRDYENRNSRSEVDQ